MNALATWRTLIHRPDRGCQDRTVRLDGGVLFDTEDRARRLLRQPWRGQAGAVRLHRRVLQHAAPPFDARLHQSGQIRATLLVRHERAMRVMVEIAAIASIRKPRRMPPERF